jgi:hypothetical protein
LVITQANQPNVYSGDNLTATTDVNGLFQFTAFKSSDYEIWYKNGDRIVFQTTDDDQQTIPVPVQGSQQPARR